MCWIILGAVAEMRSVKLQQIGFIAVNICVINDRTSHRNYLTGDEVGGRVGL